MRKLSRDSSAAAPAFMPPFILRKAKEFSSEVDTGSREENASK
jgi:hypothetical protein